MPKIQITGSVPENLPPFATYQCYNNFDSAITAQLFPVMSNNLDNTTTHIYQHEMTLQQLCLEMGSKGFPVDLMSSAELLNKLKNREQRAMHILNTMAEAIGFGPINPRSPVQVASFFYNHLRLPAIKAYDKATRQQKVTTDIKALEKLRNSYPIATAFVNAILEAREASKMASVFKRGLEPNYVLRCNFSPAGTDTGRMSSQRNPFGRGTNAQNLTNEVKQVIASLDPDFILVNFDLKTAESIGVGYISKDRAYIDACESGDLHTAVARMNWPELPWTGDLFKDKAIAERPYYRMFSYRDMAKRGGHGTNYYGTPHTMAAHLKLPTKVIAEFQESYFDRFPRIPQWHLETIAEIQTTGIITTNFPRKRRFWGRSSDPATWRAAIAYNPQSLIADVMNTGLLAVQRWIVENQLHADISLLAQVHDSGLFLVRRALVHEFIPTITTLLKVPVDFGELGCMIIPSDATLGKRWYKSKTDPDAQRDYDPAQDYTK